MRQVDPEPFYFGNPDEPLFGLHYSPALGPSREVGILLCYPVGHEYIVAHRAYRQLSIRLAEAGFHVVRFDYYASGDSGGECDQGTPHRWIRDIATAIGELRSRTRCKTTCLVGCRLGATFCALVGADRGDIDHMVLWDPVESGREHVGEMARRHQDMLRLTHVAPRPSANRTSAREFLGFALSDSALREMDAIDLRSMIRRPAQHVLLIESLRDDATAALRERLSSLGAGVTYQRIRVPHAWTWIEDPGTILVPHQLLSAIIAWIGQGAS